MPPFDITSTPIVQPPKNPLDEFDPNLAPEPWATFAPRRNYSGGRSGFKTHTRRANALAALRTHSTGVLYAWENGKWVEKARFEDPKFLKPQCDACGQDTFVDETRYDYSTRQTVLTGRKVNRIFQTFERRHRKLVEPLRVLRLCEDCRRGLGY